MDDSKIVIERCIHGIDINYCFICQQYKNMEKPKPIKDQDKESVIQGG